MVLVVRNDLEMNKERLLRQAVTVGAYQQAIKSIPSIVKVGDNAGFANIALKENSDAELMVIKRAAEIRNLSESQ